MEEDHVLEEVSVQFTLKTLQEKAHRLETENKEYKLQNQLLESQYSSQRETQADILRTLHQQLDENFRKLEQQEQTLRSRDQQIEDLKQEHKEAMELEIAQSSAKLKEREEKFEEVDSQLRAVREFIKQKAAVEGDLSSLQARFVAASEQHEKDLAALDRKKAVEIDQLKKEMLHKIRDTRDTLRLKTRDQLDATTKRTIMENEQMTTELHFQSRETERLLAKNARLLEETAQLKRAVALHEEVEHELARRTHVYQKLIRKLHFKLKQGEDSQASTMLPSQSLEPSTQDSKEKSKDKEPQAAGLARKERKELLKLRKEHEQLSGHLQAVKYEYSHYRRDHATMTQLQDESTRLIIAALYDLKNKFEEGGLGRLEETDDTEFASMGDEQREVFFRMLLEKLNQSLCATCVPAGPGSAKLPPIHTSVDSFPDVLKSISVGMVPGSHHHFHSCETTTASKHCQTEPSRTVEMSFEVVRGPVREWGPKASSRPHR
jgi:hypothetical protein